MTRDVPPLLNSDELSRLGVRPDGFCISDSPAPDCPACGTLACVGWESVPASFDTSVLRRVGTLCDPAVEDPTLAEHHPGGTHGWSLGAPIAPAWFPYNRCDVWQCERCRRAFLRYTEYGGYYVDDRIRELDAALLAYVPPELTRWP